MQICDAYWERLAQPPDGSLEDAFSEEAMQRYNEYVSAVNELGRRGSDVLEWACSHLNHPEYDAREQAAFLVGEIIARDDVDEPTDVVIDALSKLAMRPVEEDNKEAQANSSALIALGKLGDRRGIPAIRHVLTSPEWEEDDNQLMAAEALEQILGESFDDSDVVEVARDWLAENPDL